MKTRMKEDSRSPRTVRELDEPPRRVLVGDRLDAEKEEKEEKRSEGVVTDELVEHQDIQRCFEKEVNEEEIHQESLPSEPVDPSERDPSKSESGDLRPRDASS